jgi:hypothetical protein
MSAGTSTKVLAFSVIVELGTSLALMIDPTIVTRLLLGIPLDDIGTVLGRCFGITLLALALACWPSGRHAESGSSTVRGMATYNALIALYLAFLGAARHLEGLLLWPAVALHGVVALLLVWTGRGERRGNIANN